MSYIEKKFFKEGQNETSNQIDIFKNKSTGDLMFRDPLGEEILITPQGGLAPIINNLPTGPTYKVYTALLTQSGNDEPDSTYSGDLVIGRTYQIFDLGAAAGYDFTNVGAPDNNIDTRFVATGTTPNNWGTDVCLNYNAGAPVANVLENTIGNVWFGYHGVGQYTVNSDVLFTENKVWGTAYSGADDEISFIGFICSYNGESEIRLNAGNLGDNHLSIRLEIRVYN
jgi:hypothetical protein